MRITCGRSATEGVWCSGYHAGHVGAIADNANGAAEGRIGVGGDNCLRFAGIAAMICILHVMLQAVDVVVQSRAFSALVERLNAFRMLALHVPTQIGRIGEILAAIGHAAAIGALLMRLPVPVKDRLRFECTVADVAQRRIRLRVVRLHVHAQHARPLETLQADLALGLLLAIGPYPIGVRVHVALQALELPELRAAQVTDVAARAQR